MNDFGICRECGDDIDPEYLLCEPCYEKEQDEQYRPHSEYSDLYLYAEDNYHENIF